MKIVRFVKSKVNSLLNEAKEDFVKSMGCLFPIFVGTILFITFIVAYIMFISADGYGVQIANITNNGIAGIGASFTTGTVGNVYMKMLFIALQIMLVCEFIICIINYFAKESIIKKIIVAVDLIILFLFGGIFLVFDAINHRRIKLSKEQEDYIIAMMGENGADRYMKMMLVLGIISFVAIAIFIFLSLFNDNAEIFLYCVVVSVAFGVGAPIILLILQNIIPLVLVIIGLIIFGIILWLTDAVCFGRGSANSIYVEAEYLYKVHGSVEDYIQMESGFDKCKLCSLKDIRVGNVCLYDKRTGAEIDEYDIPWKN